jgi:hypothetical protein
VDERSGLGHGSTTLQVGPDGPFRARQAGAKFTPDRNKRASLISTRRNRWLAVMNWGYWGGRALGQRCPVCGEYGNHTVRRTLTSSYHWDEDTVPVWEGLLGHDLSYRKRERICHACRSTFETVEVANSDWHHLISEFLRMREAVSANDIDRRRREAATSIAIRHLRAGIKALQTKD